MNGETRWRTNLELDQALRGTLLCRRLAWGTYGHQIDLEIPVDVFSTFQVDKGTRGLLREVAQACPSWTAAIDLGCGYGPIGLYLAKAGLAEHVTCIDRDALALSFAQCNAQANVHGKARILGGLGYDPLGDERFDAVVCNLPAKAGQAAHRQMLLGAYTHLRTCESEVWTVVVEPLAGEVEAMLADEPVEVLARVDLKAHVVWRYRFTDAPGNLPAEPYARRHGRFRLRGKPYVIAAVHHLGEFDTRSWTSDLLLAQLHKSPAGKGVSHLMLCGVGQGHLAVGATLGLPRLQRLTLVDRDRLALSTSEANLRLNGFAGPLDLVHTAQWLAGLGQEDPPELIAVVVNDKETMESVLEQLSLLAGQSDCPILAVAKSNFANRLHENLSRTGLMVRRKEKGRGCTLLEMTLRASAPSDGTDREGSGQP